MAHRGVTRQMEMVFRILGIPLSVVSIVLTMRSRRCAVRLAGSA